MVVRELAGKFMAVMAREDKKHHMRIAEMRKKGKEIVKTDQSIVYPKYQKVII